MNTEIFHIFLFLYLLFTEISILIIFWEYVSLYIILKNTISPHSIASKVFQLKDHRPPHIVCDWLEKIVGEISDLCIRVDQSLSTNCWNFPQECFNYQYSKKVSFLKKKKHCFQLLVYEVLKRSLKHLHFFNTVKDFFT